MSTQRRSNQSGVMNVPRLVSNEEAIALLESLESQDLESEAAKSDNEATFEEAEIHTISSASDASDAESTIASVDGSEPVTKRAKTSSKVKKTGRSKDSVWESFSTKHNDKRKIISNKCKYCKTEVSAKPVRMNAHLKKCRHPNLTEDVTVQSNDLPASSSVSKAENIEPFPTTAEIKSRMKIWKAEEVKKSTDDMNKLLGKMIYSANLPFAFITNPYLENIVKKSSIPSYKLPNQQKISGAILDDVYSQCLKVNLAKFRDQKVVILQDGWSTNQNEPVICHSIHSGKDSLMFDAVATSMNKKDSPYCFTLLENAIKSAETMFKCNVVGVVTDNCNVMNNMREKATEKIKGFHAYGCVAHLLNLCGQQLSDNQLLGDVTKIQKFFRNHHFESAALSDLKGCRPIIPGKTRWNSQIDTLESYKKNHLLYLQISRDKKSNIRKHSDLVDILNDGNKYQLAETQLTNLKPLCVALDKVQADQCSLADAVNIWIKLLSEMPEQQRTNEYLLEKGELILTGVGLAAYMLHPKYRGAGLSREEETKGFEEMQKLHFRLPFIATSLKALDDNVFPRHLLEDNAIQEMSATGWWRGAMAYSRSISPAVKDICETLMMLPASTAAIERSFSTMGNIITKKRNRLGIEKARKLAVVHKTLNYKMDADSSDSE